SVIHLREATDEDLMDISRRHMLSLSLDEMKAIKAYFISIGRDPTDVELNTIAQTWSEHCYHKTFKGIIETNDGIIDNLLESYIFRVTKELSKPWCLVVFEDNAGIVRLEGDWSIAVKVETHNHPTALDPYGGAGTGTGGVFRDVIGVGAKPILSIDVLFFGPLDYPYELLPQGVMHPRRVMRGAVAGIRDYGNKMGVPTACGAIGFDEGYLCNPLVYAGCVGIMPFSRYTRKPKPGDLIVLVGGRTGRDGLRGVTFASTELTPESEKVSVISVQIGNPIEEKKLLDAIMRARDEYSEPLYSAITDCGGGGLSSAVGEMAKKIGAEVELSLVPLKYEGLEPWEIWLSESQERMVLAVPEGNIDKLMKIFREEDCEATVIGRFTSTGKLRVYYEGEVVCDLDLEFLFKGIPRVRRRAYWNPLREWDPDFPMPTDLMDILRRILSDPNVASKEWVIRQYDHEVQARVVIKPMVGIHGDGPSDACVLKPLKDSWIGVVISCGVNPKYSRYPYKMALSVVDEAIRNNVAVGGRRIALLDNFSWGNPEREETLGALVEAVKGCYDAAKAFDTPFISGKDSLYNEYRLPDGSYRSIPGTLLITAIGIIPDIRKAITMDFKEPGNPVYVVGYTRCELGGSYYYSIMGIDSGVIPSVDLNNAKLIMDRIVEAIDVGCIRSCHDCSEGGLAVALAESSFSGGLGVEVWLSEVPRLGLVRDDKILFSESNTRFIVEVRKGMEDYFERIFYNLPYRRIGYTTREGRLVIHGVNGRVYEEDIWSLKDAWKSTFNW
ncbi:MAG: phosphoribosylformylglycinamidine synthase subunit PurL, partial [Candidatus Bathyarchaeia archaeon]